MSSKKNKIARSPVVIVFFFIFEASVSGIVLHGSHSLGNPWDLTNF